MQAEGVRLARASAAKFTRTGQTLRELASRASTGEVEFYDTAPQALFREEGTRAHVIRPVRAKALRWMTPAGPAFATKVNHPGQRAQPWLEPAILSGADTFERFYGDEVEDEWARG